MNLTLLAWLGLGSVLGLAAFARPAYGVALYMLTYFAAPLFWWWGDPVAGYRWNLYAALVLIAALLVRNAGDAMDRLPPLKSQPATWLFIGVLNAIVVHLLFAANATSSGEWLILRMKFVLFFLLLQYAIRDRKDLRIVLTAITLGAAYIGYEVTINERGSFSGGRLEGVGAAGVTSANHLASLLVTCLPLTTILLVTDNRRWFQIAVLGCAALGFNVALLCNSRGAFLAIVLAGLVFLWMASGPARKASLRLAGIAAVGTILLLGDPEIMQRFLTTFAGDQERDNSAQSRLLFWSAAAKQLVDHPLGSGGNGFSEGRGWEYLDRGNETTGTRAIHNGFITEAVCWGLQGFALFMIFLVSVWRAIHRGRRLALERQDTPAVMTVACLAAALVAWMTTAFFGDYLDDEWGFWVAGLTLSCLRLHLAESGATASTEWPLSQKQPVPAVAHGVNM